MPLLLPARGAQNIQVGEFVFNFDDTAVDSVDGVTKTFGSVYTDALVLDCIKMPVGAIICGGEVVVETAYVGPTASTISVGVDGGAANLMAATTMKTAYARTQLDASATAWWWYTCYAGVDVRITLAHTVANASAGKVRVRVMYTINNRMNTVVTN